MCKHGTTVPMPLNGRVRAIDSCLALLVATLNTMPELATVASCCGHGRMPPSIILADERWLVILTREEADRLYAQYPMDIHGQPRNASAEAISAGHPEAACEDCGGANVSWFAPSPLWNQVIRPNGEQDNEPMLCPRCFALRAFRAGIHVTWKLAPDDPSLYAADNFDIASCIRKVDGGTTPSPEEAAYARGWAAGLALRADELAVTKRELTNARKRITTYIDMLDRWIFGGKNPAAPHITPEALVEMEAFTAHLRTHRRTERPVEGCRFCLEREVQRLLRKAVDASRAARAAAPADAPSATQANAHWEAGR